MTEGVTGQSLKKPLTLPRSFSRLLGKLIALPASESLPMANAAYVAVRNSSERALAMRLRIRLLQEALIAQKAAEAVPDEDPANAPVEVLEPAAEDIVDPEPEPVPEVKKPPKEPTLVSIDPAGGALQSMMSELGGADSDDGFFDDEP